MTPIPHLSWWLLSVLIVLLGAGFWLFSPRHQLRLAFAILRRRARVGVRQCQLDFGRVTYLVSQHGSGTPILYVHGFTGMKENWLTLMAAMGRGRRQYALDLPGWGESERPAGLAHDFAAQAERLVQFIQKEIGEPVDLVGHSMGGGVVAVLAARYPQWIRRLVLMDAAGVRFADNAFGQTVLAGGNPFAVTTVDEFKRFLALVFEHPPYVPPRLARWLVRMRIADAAFEQSVMEAIGRGPDAFLPEREAAAIQAPTLLLWCRQDRVIDSSAAAIYASIIPTGRVVMLEGRGHMPMMENTVATAATLKEFLQ